MTSAHQQATNHSLTHLNIQRVRCMFLEFLF